jgi:menaquinone-dependent protoporphyrinogen oxidase
VGHPLRPTDDDAVQIDDIVEATRAKEHRVFPGKLNRSELNCCEWALVFALRVKEGDYRNEGEVSAWAGEIAASLERQPSSSPSSSA